MSVIVYIPSQAVLSESLGKEGSTCTSFLHEGNWYDSGTHAPFVFVEQFCIS